MRDGEGAEEWTDVFITRGRDAEGYHGDDDLPSRQLKTDRPPSEIIMRTEDRNTAPQPQDALRGVTPTHFAISSQFPGL
jgi:hypothetical protein